MRSSCALSAVAVGYDSDRGDGIAVYSMEQLPSAPVAVTAAVEAEPVTAPLPLPAKRVESPSLLPWLGMMILALGIALPILAWRRLRRAAPVAKSLTVSEREAMLAKVREWLAAKPVAEAKR